MAEQIGSHPSVALLGTGIMGAAMGRCMLRAGLPLRVWNRTQDKARALEAEGASIAATPADAVKDAQVIVTMLADTDTVADTMAAAEPGLRSGQVWLQASTVGVAGLSRLAMLASTHDLIFVDSPVIGTRAPAEKGALIVLAAGPDEARAPAQHVFDAIGSRTLWLGEAGAGSRLKLVVNSWVLALTTAAAEALALAQGLDIDPRLFMETVSGGPLDCAYLQTKAAAILDGDFTPSFTVKLAGKDARLVAGAAVDAGVRLDVAPAVAARFRRAAELGHAAQDMAATYFASFDGR
ncbi:MAG: NAD(P)-dependent oxidoreductase [Micromonosporaceae bacterium]